MFMYLRFILTLALLSVVAHPSVATDARHDGKSALISGNIGESFEFVVLLDSNGNVDGKAFATSAPDCRLSFVFKAFNAADPLDPFMVDEEIVLSAGDRRVISFPFSSFADGAGDRRHVVVALTEVGRFGICRILTSVVLVGPNGETRPAGGQMVTYVDVYLGPPEL